MKRDKADFLARLPPIRTNSLRPLTIQHAFRDTGIFPFNPAEILNKIDPNQSSDEEVLQIINTPSPPPQSSSPIPTSPLQTPHSSRRIINKIIRKKGTPDAKFYAALDVMCKSFAEQSERLHQLEQTFRQHHAPEKRKQSRRRVLSKPISHMLPSYANSCIAERKAKEQRQAEVRTQKPCQQQQPILGDTTASFTPQMSSCESSTTAAHPRRILPALKLY